MTGKAQGGDRGYKRSWKNLLINKRYQLRFTLFMVGLSTVLIIGLGWWVMRVANETTTVSMASVRGTPCPKVPSMSDLEDMQVVVPPTPMKLDEPGDAPAPAPAPVPEPSTDEQEQDEDAGSAADGEPRRRTTVTISESSMTMIPVEIKAPPDYGQKLVAQMQCEKRLARKIDDLERGRALILYVLIGTGLLLVVGLAIYGIKMTHKVAGPLFKVSLYLAKMRDGRFDKVWNLRKGDQLVDFYEHFKTAHAGVVQMQKDDIAKLEDVIAAAEAAGRGDHPIVVELRDLVAAKEKAIE